jgi:hypothetical protein
VLNKSSNLVTKERHMVIYVDNKVEKVIDSVKGPMLKQSTCTLPNNVAMVIQV